MSPTKENGVSDGTNADGEITREQLAAIEKWDAETITAALSAFAENSGVKAGRPMWQARIAVSGCAVTPGGPGEIMEILGKEESLRRIDRALEKF